MSESPIIFGKGEDPKMLAAVQHARETFKFMWRELSWEYRRIIPGLDLQAIKVAFPVKKRFLVKAPEVELMWVSDLQFDGREIKGTLLNNPNWVKGIKAGSPVSVALAEIHDWMYAMSGVVYGAHTVQVLRASMSLQERVQHDEAWGLDFGEPATVRLAPRPVKGQDGQIKGDYNHAVTDASELEAVEHPMSINMKHKAIEMLEQRPDLLEGVDDEGWTMMQREALAGNATSVYVLLKKGADKSLTNPFGETAMDLARKMGWPKVIEVLDKY